MNDKTKIQINKLGLIIIGIGIGIAFTGMFIDSAGQMVESCNSVFGAGNWNVTKIDGSWYCTSLEVQYFDIEFDCVKVGVCNASELPQNYTIDLTNRNLTIISEIP